MQLFEDRWHNEPIAGRLIFSIFFGLGWVGGAWLLDRFWGASPDFLLIFLAAATGVFYGVGTGGK